MQYVVLMLKEPHPGRVKTRLGRDIGNIEAAWWFRHQIARLLRRIRDPRWQIILAVSPDQEGVSSRVWPDDLKRWPQGKGDLGARMGRIFRYFPPSQVVIIGSDIPAIQPRHIAAAFKTLGSNDAVFGPSPDGGYWLIGLKRVGRIPASFLGSVRWSSQHALKDTLETLAGQSIAFIEILRDVDRAEDLSADDAKSQP